MLNSTKIILLSGKGNRFKEKGYTLPKGLLKIGGVELAIHAANSLPECETSIFAIQDFVNKKYNFHEILQNKYFNKFKIFKFKEYTNGQATSCYDIINNINEIIKSGFFVLSCDFSFNVASNEIKKIINKKIDAVVFTYRAADINYKNESIYGWIRSSDDNKVTDVSCKKRILPHKLDDHVIIGSFYFSNISIYKKYYKKLISDENYINGETYIDVIIQLMVEDGLEVINYEVDDFKDFGTPDQYEVQNNK